MTAITVLVPPGTSLFNLAATYLGDATAWTRIAELNRIRDPFVTELTTLLIPGGTLARATHAS